MGGCDAQACQQAQQDDHHRQDATQPGTQMHETETPSPNTKQGKRRLQNKVLPVGKLPIPQRQSAQQIVRIIEEASRLPDVPCLSAYHPAHRQHISQVQPPGDNEPD